MSKFEKVDVKSLDFEVWACRDCGSLVAYTEQHVGHCSATNDPVCGFCDFCGKPVTSDEGSEFSNGEWIHENGFHYCATHPLRQARVKGKYRVHA